MSSGGGKGGGLGAGGAGGDDGGERHVQLLYVGCARLQTQAYLSGLAVAQLSVEPS